jgi:predicted nucleotidyltransferase
MIQKSMTKNVKRYGNSGGVYLPSSWIGGTVEISLVTKPARPEEDIPLAFARELEHIISILLYGSHARGEHEPGSDMDVIVVTDEHQKAAMKAPQDLKGKGYDIMVVQEGKLRSLASRDILLNKSLEDAKAILNDSFLDELKSIRPKGSLRERIGLARSSLGIMRSLLEAGSDPVALAYPLMMRLKEALLMGCVVEGRKYSLKLLEERVRKAGVQESEYRRLMDAYRSVRAGNKPGKQAISEPAARLLLALLEEMIADAEKDSKKEGGPATFKRPLRDSPSAKREQIELHKQKLKAAEKSGNIGLADYYEKEIESLESALGKKRKVLGGK